MTVGDAPGWSPGDAGTLVRGYLAAQVAELTAHEPGVRARDPEAVHDMRVATRRLRSALSTFRPVLQRERTDPLRAALRRWGQVLGEVRDADVSHAALAALLDEEPAGLVLGPVRDRLGTDRAQALDVAHEHVVAELDGLAAAHLRAGLAMLVADPPLAPEAARPAAEVLPGRARREFRRLRHALRAAQDEPGGPARDHEPHEARKAARRARYAAEVLVPAAGQPAERSARDAQRVQDLLGAHQDAVVERELLRRLAAEATAMGESAFSYGRLHEQARERAVDAERRLPRAARRVTDQGRLAWTR